MRACDLDSSLPAEHQARAIWAFVQSLDLQTLYAQIRAVEGSVGRDQNVGLTRNPGCDDLSLRHLQRHGVVEAQRAIDRPPLIRPRSAILHSAAAWASSAQSRWPPAVRAIRCPAGQSLIWRYTNAELVAAC
ncbi:hypothetical protein B1A_04971, partial [mine drainage metagenome]